MTTMRRVKVADRPPVTFEEAAREYTNRFTMEHVPAWARQPVTSPITGRAQYPAPQFRTDREWFEHSTFPTDRRKRYCETTGQTWPLGLWLDAPYRKEITD